MFVKDTAAKLSSFWGGAGIACCCSESLSAHDGRMSCGEKFLIQLCALAAKESQDFPCCIVKVVLNS